MTVDDFEMARGRRFGQEDTPERWKDLADLRDGRREQWMTDRAKHALGTPKWVFVPAKPAFFVVLRRHHADHHVCSIEL